MKKLLILLLLLVPAFFYLSCDYELTQSNYVDVKKEPIPINLVYADSTGSQIELSSRCLIIFSANLEKRTVHDLQFKIDGKDENLFWSKRIIDDSTKIYEFTVSFNSENLSDGNHSFEVEVTANSGTGSLADISGNEIIIYSRSWQILINNSAPTPVVIDSIYPENGMLKVVWKKCSRQNFKNYELNRSVSTPLNLFYNLVKNTSDPSDTVFYDKEYLGGPIAYLVNVNTINRNSSGIVKTFSSTVPEVIKTEKTDDIKLKVYWSRCKYDSNFSKYNLMWEDINNNLSTSNNIEDTTVVTDQIAFGDVQNIGISTRNKSNNPLYSKWYECYIGEKMPGYFLIRYIKANNSFYTVNEEFNTIKRYDAETMAELNSVKMTSYNGNSNQPRGAFDVSEDGNYCYYSTLGYIYKLNPLSLSVEEQYSTKQLSGDILYLKQMNISNNNLLVFNAYKYSINDYYNEDGCYLVDLNKQKILKRVNYDGAPSIISPSGNVARLGIRYVKIYADSASLAFGNNYQGNSIFTPDDKYVIESYDNVISIRDINSFKYIKSIGIPIDSPYYFNYDPVTSLLGFKRYNKYYIYNIDAEKIVKQINTRPNSENIQFFNSTVYASTGYYLHLNLK